jgi:hypothetical protein
MNLQPHTSEKFPGKFPIGSRLKHLKTGGYYRIAGLAKIEATLEMAYVYESLQTHDYWVRPQAEMEDGRFELCAEC